MSSPYMYICKVALSEKRELNILDESFRKYTDQSTLIKTFIVLLLKMHNFYPIITKLCQSTHEDLILINFCNDEVKIANDFLIKAYFWD